MHRDERDRCLSAGMLSLVVPATSPRFDVSDCVTVVARVDERAPVHQAFADWAPNKLAGRIHGSALGAGRGIDINLHDYFLEVSGVNIHDTTVWTRNRPLILTILADASETKTKRLFMVMVSPPILPAILFPVNAVRHVLIPTSPGSRLKWLPCVAGPPAKW